MLDIRVIREDPERIKAGARRKGIPRDEEIDRILHLDKEIRGILPELEGLRADQKKAGKALGKALPEDREKLIGEQKRIKARIKELEEKEKALREELAGLMLLVPNPPDPDVPVGESEEDNVEVRRWGEVPDFDFQPRDHVDLAEMHGLADFKRAGKIAGSRNYFLWTWN